jgi:hypothetical protein
MCEVRKHPSAWSWLVWLHGSKDAILEKAGPATVVSSDEPPFLILQGSIRPGQTEVNQMTADFFNQHV